MAVKSKNICESCYKTYKQCKHKIKCCNKCTHYIKLDSSCGVCGGEPLDLEIEELKEENKRLRKEIGELKQRYYM